MYLFFILILFIFGNELSAEVIVDKSKCIDAINKNYKLYDQCSKELKSDFDILKTTKYSSIGRVYSSESINKANEYYNLDGELGAGPDLWFSYDLPDWLLGNKDFVMAALPYVGLDEEVQLISKSLLDDVDVAEVVANYVSLTDFSIFSERIRDHRPLMLKLLNNNGYQLRNVSERLKDDKELALLAIKSRPHSFEYVSDRLKDDRELVYLAITDSGYLLKYASERLRDDFDLVKTALHLSTFPMHYHIETDGDVSLYAIQHVSNRLYNHPEFAIFRRYYENKIKLYEDSIR